MNNLKKKDFFDGIYFASDGKSGSFGSLRPLYYAAKKRDSSVTVKEVKEYLKSVRSYVRHKRILRSFVHRSFLTFYPNEFWMSDIIYIKSMKSIMKQKKASKNYAITVIDTFTKKGYTRSMLRKSATLTLEAFQSIISEAKAIPKTLQVDQGGEYKGQFSVWCKENKVKLYSSSTPEKSALCENFNYQLKLILNRILTHYHSTDSDKYLQQACSIYNSQPSSGLPNRLSPDESIHHVSEIQSYYLKKRAELATKDKKRRPAPIFSVGQSVRKLENSKFIKHRGFKPRFSENIYKIVGITNSRPRSYLISDHQKKIFYPEQLSAVVDRIDDLSPPKIQNIVKSRNRIINQLRNGKIIKSEKEYLCIIDNEVKPRYLTQEKIEKYINGTEILNEYLAKQHGE